MTLNSLTTLAQDDSNAAHFPAQCAAAEQNIHMFVVGIHRRKRDRLLQLLHHSAINKKVTIKTRRNRKGETRKINKRLKWK